MKYSLENWIKEDGEKFLKDIGIKKKGPKGIGFWM
jgi:hypothetical protein